MIKIAPWIFACSLCVGAFIGEFTGHRPTQIVSGDGHSYIGGYRITSWQGHGAPRLILDEDFALDYMNKEEI